MIVNIDNYIDNIYTTYNRQMTLSPKNLNLQKIMQCLQYFKARIFQNYNKQIIVYNENKHNSKLIPKSYNYTLNSI